MEKEQELLSLTLLEKLQTSGAGYDVLRYIGLPELLGTEAYTLLYFMGRNLARKLDIKAMDDIYYSYEKLGWGRLELIKSKRNEFIFYLMADSVVQRLEAPINTEFRLEAGFLAEAVQRVKETPCECSEKINTKIHQIEFTVIFTN